MRRIERSVWRLIGGATPGYLIRSRSAILTAVYLWIAAKAFAAEELERLEMIERNRAGARDG